MVIPNFDNDTPNNKGSNNNDQLNADYEINKSASRTSISINSHPQKNMVNLIMVSTLN